MECVWLAYTVCRVASLSLVSPAYVSSLAVQSLLSCQCCSCRNIGEFFARYLAETATMVISRVIIDVIMGPFEMLKSEESMARLRKREHAPLTPYLKGIENRHRVIDQL